MVDALRLRLAPMPVEHGYLEFARPILRDGLEALREKGVTKVLAIPAMLFAAGHAKNDIPSVLNTYTAETGLPIDYGRELGVDRLMVSAAGARVQECLDAAEHDVPLAETKSLHQQPRHLGHVGVGVWIRGASAHHHQQSFGQGNVVLRRIQALLNASSGGRHHQPVHPQLPAVIDR